MFDSQEELERQLARYRSGVAAIHLDRPCIPGDGLRVLSPPEKERFIKSQEQAQVQGRFSKFVPASGAASRMFKTLLQYAARLKETGREADLSLLDSASAREISLFFENFPRLAIAPLASRRLEAQGLTLEQVLRTGRHRLLLDVLFGESALNLSGMPKGLLPFHLYPSGPRSALIEQCVEGVAYLADGQKRCRIHLTISPEHEEKFKLELEKCPFQVSFSFQQPATDALAVDLENRPLRDEQGRFLFRPSGHGALLENLQATGGDLVYLQNIDNVAAEPQQAAAAREKKILGGMLVELQKNIFQYLRELNCGQPSPHRLQAMADFFKENFGIAPKPEAKTLRQCLNRPLRVCGMVPNRGAPGGGPYWVRGATGEVSPQIVESAQIDLQNAEQNRIFSAATHFNPVIMVCGLRDVAGHAFALTGYVDEATAFIAHKSHQGQEIKILERPGLWNGSMAYWNTVFVEISEAAFTPAKTVMDLLQPSHQV